MTTSPHIHIITLDDGREICQSYGTTVAAFIPTDYHAPHRVSGYVRTDRRFSVTTSKHVNQYAGKDAVTVPHDELLRLTAPVRSKQ